MIGSMLAIGGLIALARRIPTTLGLPMGIVATGTRRLVILGLLFFPAVILTGGVSSGLGVSPVVPVVLDLAFAYLLIRTLRRSVRATDNDREELALSFGLVMPIILFGFIASAGVTLLADTGFLLFMRRLWKQNRKRTIAISMPSLGTGLPPAISGQS